MQPKSPKWLDDIAGACAFILEHTGKRSLSDYENDLFLRSAIERNFEIVGEALVRLERTDPTTAGQITDHRKIIGFRNRLAHGYDDIDNQQVWEIIQQYVPALRTEVEHLLRGVEDG